MMKCKPLFIHWSLHIDEMAFWMKAQNACAFKCQLHSISEKSIKQYGHNGFSIDVPSLLLTRVRTYATHSSKQNVRMIFFFLITDVLKYQISTSGVSNLFSRLVQTMHLFWIQFLNRSSVLYFGQSVYSIWERTIWWGNNFHKCPWMLSVHNFRFSLFPFCDLKSKHVQHFKCAQIRYKLHFERFV